MWLTMKQNPSMAATAKSSSPTARRGLPEVHEVGRSVSAATSRKTVTSRKSISAIFSRKENESPEPSSPIILPAAMPKSKPMTERQQSWLSKRRSARQLSGSDNSSSRDQHGTVLNAVPPADCVRNNSLDREVTAWMARSTHADIISALSGSFKPNQPEERSRKTKHGSFDANARVGLWVNGVAHWDDDMATNSQEPVRIQGMPGRVIPQRSSSVRPAVAAVASKPHLSVTIPSQRPLVSSQNTIAPTMSRSRSLVSAITLLPGNDQSTTPYSSDHVVSPVTSDSIQAVPISPPRRQGSALHVHPEVAEGRNRSPSSSSSTASRDDHSLFSNKSSATSIELPAADVTVRKITAKAPQVPNVNKPLPAPPVASQTSLPRYTISVPPSSPAPGRWLGHHKRSTTAITVPQPGKDRAVFGEAARTRSSFQLEFLDRAFIMAAPSHPVTTTSSSPTLSEAELDLEAHLCTTARSSIYSQEPDALETCEWPDEAPDSSPQSPERAPSLPRRSRKREWVVTPADQDVLRCRRKSETDLSPSQEAISNRPLRTPSVSSVPLLAAATHSYADCVYTPDDPPISAAPSVDFGDEGIVVPEPTTTHSGRLAAVSPMSAEHVLLRILSSLESIDDLHNMAMVNRGMYRVYQENESWLLHTVLRKQSPAAWEFREWSLSAQLSMGTSCPETEFTAASCLQSYHHDLNIIRGLKQRIIGRCRFLVRPDTADTLSAGTYPDVQRFDDAFWRIWSFCAIFGSGKDREDDVTGQLDWLRGGILAHNLDLTATNINFNLDLDVDASINPPDFFAKGNTEHGLSDEQLYDLVEFWNCLKTMLHGYHGRTAEARQYGVFDGLDVADTSAEEELLEEWTAYLMSLGPAVILEMAALADNPDPSGFALAKANGWIQWCPKEGSSRTTFFQEPARRLYEERVSAASMKLHNPRDQKLREKSRKRVSNLAAEIKLARTTSTYKHLPVIDMAQEQPVSAVSRCSSLTSATTFSSERLTTVSRRSTVDTASRPGSWYMDSKSSRAAAGRAPPIIEEMTEPLDFTSLQRFGEGIAEDTSDRALKRIVSMGFPAPAAREALRMTDTGDGLRVDRAVDLLLKRQ